MAGQLLSPSERLLFLPERGRVSAVIEMPEQDGSSEISLHQSLSGGRDIQMESRADTAGSGCIRGTMFALVFEAGAALLIYGICQLWHLFR